MGKKKIKEIQRRKERGVIFRFKVTLSVSCRSRRSLLLSAVCGQYIWLLVCRDMAIWPLFLWSRMPLSWRSGHQLHRFIPMSSVWYELRPHGNFLPYASGMQRKPAKILASLGFWPDNKRMKSEFQRFFSVPHKRQSGDDSGTASIPWLFDHYASESNTHCFGLISGFFPRLVIMLESCQS